MSKDRQTNDQLRERLEQIRDWLFEEVDGRSNSGGKKPDINSFALNKNLSTGVALVNEQGLFTYVDENFVRLFGYDDPEKFLQKHWQMLYGPDIVDKFKEEIIPELRKGSKWEGEVEINEKLNGKGKIELNLARTTEGDVVCKASDIAEATEEGKKMVNRDDSKTDEGIADLREGLEELQNCETKEDIYDTSLRIAAEILDFDLCTLQLQEENTIIVKVSRNEPGGENPIPNVIGGNLSTITQKRGEVIQGSDLSRYSHGNSISELTNSFVSVPVESLGTLQVFSTREEAFSERDVNLMQILAKHLRERVARAELEGEVGEQAIHDQLTGLYNRHYLEEALAKEVQRAQRYNHTISFLMIDINGFKEVNDRYSHAKGDRVLKRIGTLIRENVREVDTVIRYGGDEFLVLLPETGEGSQVVIERLKEQVKKWSEETEKLEFPLSIAVGSSNLEPGEEVDVEEKISEADRRMYDDKNGMAG